MKEEETLRAGGTAVNTQAVREQ